MNGPAVTLSLATDLTAASVARSPKRVRKLPARQKLEIQISKSESSAPFFNRMTSQPLAMTPVSSSLASSSAAQSGSGQIGMSAAVSIGIGGMVGAGIFSILGVVAQAAGNAMWLAFAIGGVVALLSTYSYAKLGATFPSAGGAVHFLVKGFGDGVFAGGLNLFMWAGCIISLALYATAFGGYAATFVTTTPSPLLLESLAVIPVLVLTLINAFGARLMGRWETVIVAITLVILVLFAAVRLSFLKPGHP